MAVVLQDLHEHLREQDHAHPFLARGSSTAQWRGRRTDRKCRKNNDTSAGNQLIKIGHVFGSAFFVCGLLLIRISEKSIFQSTSGSDKINLSFLPFVRLRGVNRPS